MLSLTQKVNPGFSSSEQIPVLTTTLRLLAHPLMHYLNCSCVAAVVLEQQFTHFVIYCEMVAQLKRIYGRKFGRLKIDCNQYQSHLQKFESPELTSAKMSMQLVYSNFSLMWLTNFKEPEGQLARWPKSGSNYHQPKTS